jgi:putative phage-type endonuclease
MAIVNIAQRTPEWFAWRNEGITASMIPVILGMSPYKTPYELWAELCGFKEPDDLSKNWHVQRGIAQEPEAREWYENETGRPYLPLCVEADHNPLFRASLDGLYGTTEKDRDVLEVKCPCEKIFLEIGSMQGQSPNFKMYVAQVQWQLNAANASKGKLFFWLRKHKPITALINRNDKFIAHAEKEALKFWDLIQTKTPPQMIEGRDKTIYHKEVQKSEWDSHSTAYRTVEQKIKEMKAEIAKLEAEAESHADYLKSLIPSGLQTFTKDGIRVTKVTRDGSTDNKKLIDLIEKEFGITVTSEMYKQCKKDDSVSYRITVQEQDEEVSDVETEKVSDVETKKVSDVETEDAPLMPLSPDNFFNKSTQSMYF